MTGKELGLGKKLMLILLKFLVDKNSLWLLQGQGSNKIKLPELIKGRKEVQDKRIEKIKKEVLVCQIEY